jgi:acetyl esterase/lipase
MSKEQQLALDAFLRQGGLDTGGDVPALRAAFDELMAQIPVAPDIQQAPVALGGVGGVEVVVGEPRTDNVMLYFHGGVYVIGSASASVPLVGDIARRTAMRVYTLDYRLGPEHPYPAAVQDAVAAYQGLLNQGVHPDRIAVAGESAGGGLAVAALLALRDAGNPLPACAFVMSPYVDLTLSGDSMKEKSELDPLLNPDDLRTRVPDYVADGQPADPLISPVFADLSGLPPLLIQVGTHEVLLSDAVRLAARAASADVPVILDVTPGVPHVFQAYAAILEEGADALERATSFLDAHLHDGVAVTD